MPGRIHYCFFSVDIYTCAEFDEVKVTEFTSAFFRRRGGCGEELLIGVATQHELAASPFQKDTRAVGHRHLSSRGVRRVRLLHHGSRSGDRARSRTKRLPRRVRQHAELLDEEYHRYEPASYFVCVVDHRRAICAAMMRIIVPIDDGPGLRACAM